MLSIKYFNYKHLGVKASFSIALIILLAALTSCQLGSTTPSNIAVADPATIQLSTNISGYILQPESSVELIISTSGLKGTPLIEPVNISSSNPSIATVSPDKCILSGKYPSYSCSVTVTAVSPGEALINISGNSYTSKQVTIKVIAQYAYVSLLHVGIAAYRVDINSGAWLYLGVIGSGNTYQSVVTPSKNYVYAGHNSNVVLMYAINKSTGLLEPLSPSTVGSGDSPFALAVDPYGRYLYVANDGDGTISMYKIESNGILTSLTPESVVLSIGTPSGITVDPLGRYVYVISLQGAAVAIYSIDSDSGQLTPATPESGIALGFDPGDIVVHQSGKYAYITRVNSVLSGVYMYNLESSSGMLTPMQPESYISSGLSPDMILIDNSGRHAYTANRDSSTISMYDINSINGSLSSLGSGSVSAPTSVFVLAIDPLDRYLYAGTGTNATTYMSVYSIESGILTQVSSVDLSNFYVRSISIVRFTE